MRKPTAKLLGIIAIALIAMVAILWIVVASLLSGDRIKNAIEAQASAAIGRPVAIRSATPHLFPRVGLDLTEIAIGASREVTIEHATLTTGLKALLQRRVEDAEISIVRSQIDIRWALDLLAAFSAAPASASASSAPAFAVESIGTLALRDVTLVAGKRPLHVDLDSSLTGGDRLVVSRLRGTSDGSDLVAKGELTSIARRTGAFSIDAQTLDLDGLLAFLGAATPAGGQIDPPKAAAPRSANVPLHIDIDVKARQGRAVGVALNGLSAKCEMRGDDVLLQQLKVGLFDGSFSGAAAFRGGRGEPVYEWRGTFDHLDIPQLMTFAGATGSMTGRLAGSMALSAAGSDAERAMQRAKGSTKIVATDGKIPGLDIVRTVILAFGKPSGAPPAGSGEAFSRIAATIAVNGPSLTTNDLAFASRDFDMTGQGALSLASRAIDFRTDIALSSELSAQAGRDLYRLAHEGERIVLPAKITGTVASPSVFIDVQAALGRALRNKAQDQIKSLFDRLIKK
jgi:uncharacterized protein involved in outer membrane biogenesis